MSETMEPWLEEQITNRLIKEFKEKGRRCCYCKKFRPAYLIESHQKQCLQDQEKP